MEPHKEITLIPLNLAATTEQKKKTTRLLRNLGAQLKANIEKNTPVVEKVKHPEDNTPKKGVNFALASHFQ